MCSVSYSVVINEKHSEYFVPSRGLRQGDLLSPYLFLFCVEGLSVLLSHTEDHGLIRRVTVSRHAPRVSYLLFADDSMLFIKASIRECDAILNILRVYKEPSRQYINVDKLALLFSSNTPMVIRSSIMDHLNIAKTLENDKYLGLLIMVGKSRRKEFQLLKDSLW